MSTSFQAHISDGGCLPDGQASVVKQFNRVRNGISAHWTILLMCGNATRLQKL